MKQTTKMHADYLHKNNFDFIRLFAAFMVLYSHQFTLSGLTEPTPLPGISYGTLALFIFFSISGYLTSQSWENDPNFMRFIARRILRIWPGLAASCLFIALLAGPYLSTNTPEDYFSSTELYNYFSILRMKLSDRLPGVFINNPFPHAINGSLWSIPLEIKWYLILSLLGVTGILKRPPLLFLTIFFYIIYLIFIYKINNKWHDSGHYIHEFGLFFCYGIFLQKTKSKWQSHRKIIYATISIAFIILNIINQSYLSILTCIPPLAILTGSASTKLLNRTGEFGDFSFGVYIYAFPIQQGIIWSTANRLPFYYALTLSCIITFIFAILSWRHIEKPSLRLKSKLTSHHLAKVQPPASF